MCAWGDRRKSTCDMATTLPGFTADGLLPKGDYKLTLDALRSSMLVRGPAKGHPNWDRAWRSMLVEGLEVLVRQLWLVGITEIFVDGSFAEDKDHPNDIDGYFECELDRLASGELERELNLLDPHKVWTWDPSSRRPYGGKHQLPMWHQYRVELYPHYSPLQGSGIQDKFGNELTFPWAFRISRRDSKPRGIIKVIAG